MEVHGNDLIQAIEWRPGSPFGTNVVKTASVVQCITDGDMEAEFPGGTETRSFKAQDTVVLPNIQVKVLSGTFDIN